MPASHLTADQIRTARESQGYTRLELAARLAGATPAEYEMAQRLHNLFKTITNWETGKQIPSPAYADLIRRTLKITD
jgi:transcriptional regulator with XRE-family HTH domain